MGTTSKESSAKPRGSTTAATPTDPKEASAAPTDAKAHPVQSARSDSPGGTQITINIHPTVREASPKNTPREVPAHQDSNPGPSKSVGAPAKPNIPPATGGTKAIPSRAITPSASDVAPADEDDDLVSNSKPIRASPPAGDREDDEAGAGDFAPAGSARNSEDEKRRSPKPLPKQATSAAADSPQGVDPAAQSAALGQLLAERPEVLPASLPPATFTKASVAAPRKRHAQTAASGVNADDGLELLPTAAATAPNPKTPAQAPSSGSLLQRADSAITLAPALAKDLPRAEAPGPAAAVQEAVKKALPKLRAARASSGDQNVNVAPTETVVPGEHVARGTAPASQDVSLANSVPTGTAGGRSPDLHTRQADAGRERAEAEASTEGPVDESTIDGGSADPTTTPTSQDRHPVAASQGVTSDKQRTVVAGGEVDLDLTKA